MAGQHSPNALEQRLQGLGLAPLEARVYLALLGSPPLGAQAVAETCGITRTSGYAALRALIEHGLVESGAGYGSKFRTVAPEVALSSFVDRQRVTLTEELDTRERIAKELVEDMADIAGDAGVSPDEVVEVIKSRRALQERQARLQAEAQEEIDAFVKAPIYAGRGNPAEEEALARGVRVRALYEEAVLSDPAIEPHLRQWVAKGEEARIYPGELPMKAAIFDSSRVLMPLELDGNGDQVLMLVVRHRSLTRALRSLFDRMWAEARPVEGTRKVSRTSTNEGRGSK